MARPGRARPSIKQVGPPKAFSNGPTCFLATVNTMRHSFNVVCGLWLKFAALYTKDERVSHRTSLPSRSLLYCVVNHCISVKVIIFADLSPRTVSMQLIRFFFLL